MKLLSVSINKFLDGLNINFISKWAAIQNTNELGILLPSREADHSAQAERVLIIEALNATPHLETGLEIAFRLAVSGYKVYYMHIGSYLPYVEFFHTSGVFNRFSLLGLDKTPQALGGKLLNSACKTLGIKIKFLKANRRSRSIVYRIPNKYLDSLDSLMKYSPIEFPELGVSVASSLVSLQRSSYASPTENANLCDKLASSHARAFEITKHAVQTIQAKSIVVFNGRFACVKGICSAARMNNINIYYHERGSTKDRFSLYPFQPHDRVSMQKYILDVWRSLPKQADAANTAANYYKARYFGLDTDWTSFTTSQTSGDAAPIIEKARLSSTTGKVLVFFSSSEDEFIGCSDLWDTDQFEWKTQIEALILVVKFALRQGHGLIVRNHPHLTKKAPLERTHWDSLSFIPPDLKDSLFLVPSHSSASSYELILGADAIITYGSTVGIEAVYWEKPSILLGNSEYDNCCDLLYRPKTASELESTLKQVGSLLTSREASYPYGYHRASHGIDYKLYQAEDLFNGFYLGKNLRDNWLDQLRIKLQLRTKLSNFKKSYVV